MSVIASANLGAVAPVRGSVVDVRVDGPLLPIYSVVGSDAKKQNRHRSARGGENA
jgi:hypothetical protein